MTLNRGIKALNVAKQLLPELDNDWELLFLDNSSTVETDSYSELFELASGDNVLRYIRHDSNRDFCGNYLACFEMASAPYIMIMSDEDFANPQMIRDVLPLLNQYPNVGIMRGSIVPIEGVTPKNSFTLTDSSYINGDEALLNYAFLNNYISGTIYNRELLIKTGIVDKFSKELKRHYLYPHLYLELLASAITDVVVTSKVCCFEGLDQPYESNNSAIYAVPYSFGSRVDQFIILRDACREAVNLARKEFDATLFVNLYLKLCQKYFYLITRVNSPMYIKNSIHPGLLHQSMLYICGAAISMYPEIQHCDTEIFTEIQKIHARYEMFIQENGNSV